MLFKYKDYDGDLFKVFKSHSQSQLLHVNINNESVLLQTKDIEELKDFLIKFLEGQKEVELQS